MCCPWAIASTVPQLRPKETATVASVHEVGWFAADEVLDVVDELVGKRLHRLITCPRDMRGQDEVRRVQEAEQRVIVARRLRRQHIKSGTSESMQKSGAVG
jgi:hypothetical protein